MPTRKNGNALFHEILSIPRSKGLSIEQQAEILYDLTLRYLDQRAPKQLGVAMLHVEGHHLHVHLILSSNEYRKPQRVRLQKKKFLQLQKQLETYCLEKYPELNDKPVYEKNHVLQSVKGSDREYQTKKRTGQLSKKGRLRNELGEIFETVQSESELNLALQAAGITLRKRGKNITATRDNLKCRLSTLGLQDGYDACLEEESLKRKERLAELSAIRDQNADWEREYELNDCLGSELWKGSI